jgi:hypothetical protein
MEGLDVGLKAIGAGLSMIGAAGAGIGVGLVVQGALQAMGRNPDFAGTLQTSWRSKPASPTWARSKSSPSSAKSYCPS